VTAGSGEEPHQGDADTAVVGLLADLLGADRLGLEADAVLGLDDRGAQLAEERLQDRKLGGAEPEQVSIAGWAMGDVEPQVEEQGPLEQEALGVPGCAQPIEEPLQGVAGQNQIEVLAPGLRLGEEPGADGCPDVRPGHARASR
jgi:hypothetical protein